MLDAVELERRGIPTAVVGASLLVNTTGRGMALAHGFGNLKMVEIDQASGIMTSGSDERDDIQELVNQAIPQIEAIFLGKENEETPRATDLSAMGGTRQPSIEESLHLLGRGLAADGYNLIIGSKDGSTLLVQVEATPEACDDCLVPPKVMESIILAHLPAEARVERVEVTYPPGYGGES